MSTLSIERRAYIDIQKRAIIRVAAIYCYSVMHRLAIASAMFALVAAMAGSWTAYEARQARLGDERPFLDVEPEYDDGIVTSTFRLHAYGKSPSKNIELLCSFAGEGVTLDWNAVNRGRGQWRNYMVPGEDLDFTCNLAKGTESTRSYVLYGVVKYTDTSGVGHSSPFCYSFSRVPLERTIVVQCPFSILRGEPTLE